MKQRTSRQVWDTQPHRLVMLNSFVSACLLFDSSVRDDFFFFFIGVIFVKPVFFLLPFSLEYVFGAHHGE